ncbi:aldo/keto reductase [Streptomyces sp. 2132.2]|uniref:aldo/keto reductase n=1 Tax=Streptomyces sp. 2132.2 TaxID=2485161 RepID=UPI0037D9D809
MYQLHKPDPAVPWAESVGALHDLVEAGTIRAAGISNVTTDQIRHAHTVLGDALVSVQNRYSPAVRDSEPQLRLCTALGLAFPPLEPARRDQPQLARRPAGGPAAAGTAFQRIAAGRGVSPQQVALAWLLSRSPVVIPVPGASRPAPSPTRPGAPIWS